MRLLLVEDDQQLSQSLSKALKREGFSLLSVNNGKEAIVCAEFDHVDIVILDLGLPDIDGIEVLRQIKSKKLACRVLILTARDQLSDKVNGLDAGADDYLVKPFEYDELAARIRVLERRLAKSEQLILEVGDLSLDPKGHVAHLNAELLALSKKEYLLLKALMESAGRIQTKESLEAKLYDFAEEISSNSVEVHIHNLRKKLPKNRIKTVRGIGYTMKQDKN
jgi:two-component system, OmpR family, response regulator